MDDECFDTTEYSEPQSMMRRYTNKAKLDFTDTVHALQAFRELKARLGEFLESVNIKDYESTHSINRIERILECRVGNCAMRHVYDDTSFEPNERPVNEALSADGYDKCQENLEEMIVKSVSKALNKGQNCPNERRAK